MRPFPVLILLLLSLQWVQAQDRGFKPVQGGTAPASTERRLALVVGNKDYRTVGADLQNPGNDADDMAVALDALGFTVIKKINLDRIGMERSIDEFGRQLKNYDVGLFYYSGHGIQQNEENYLVPTDADMSQATEIEYQCVKLGRVFGAMEGAASKVSLVLLDACRNNPFPKGSRGAVSAGLTIPNNPTGSFVAFAMRAGSSADDNVGQHNGLFTSELLKYICQPSLGLRTIMDHTITGVRTRSGGKQIPGRYDELEGDFVFVQPTGPTPVVAEVVVQPSRQEPEVIKSEPVVNPRIRSNRSKLEVLGQTESKTDLEPIPMIYIEGGAFQMGSKDGESDEKPVHNVTVSSFRMASTETTVTQYRWYCEETGAKMPEKLTDNEGSHDMNPIENVSWEDAVGFCKWLTRKTRLIYRLPTEAEWEYAARGGKSSHGYIYAGSNSASTVSWLVDNSRDKKHPIGKTHLVGKKLANELGLYDMSGNVWEWCSDWYDEAYYASSSDNNPTGPSSGANRVLRGGCSIMPSGECRVATRNGYGNPATRSEGVGFRVVSQLK